MPRLQNKIALITGAARGIGAETARLFIREGATVVLTDILDDIGTALARELGERATYLHLDVGDEEKWIQAIGFVEKKFGRLDVLFNNAGITGLGGANERQDPEHATLDCWHRVHRVNSDGVFLGCKHAIGLMKQHGGSIINMSSRSGMVGVPGSAAYAASKADIRNHTKSVALYCAQQGYGIRCNSVNPAAILTPMWDDMLGKSGPGREAALAAIIAGIPIGKIGEPIDVAYAVLFLASDESKYMTGSEMIIDGGILAGSSAAPNQKKQ